MPVPVPLAAGMQVAWESLEVMQPLDDPLQHVVILPVAIPAIAGFALAQGSLDLKGDDFLRVMVFLRLCGEVGQQLQSAWERTETPGDQQ